MVAVMGIGTVASTRLKICADIYRLPSDCVSGGNQIWYVAFERVAEIALVSSTGPGLTSVLTRVRNDGRAAGMRGAGLKGHGVAAGHYFWSA